MASILSSILARARFATSRFAPNNALSGIRLFSTKHDYKAAKYQAMYCNHSKCDSDLTKGKRGKSEPQEMRAHWLEDHESDCDCVNFCDICGNSVAGDNGVLPCRSFPPTDECPRWGGRVPGDPEFAKPGGNQPGESAQLRGQDLRDFVIGAWKKRTKASTKFNHKVREGKAMRPKVNSKKKGN